MKTIFIILAFCLTVYAQNKVCEERGHILGNIATVTLMMSYTYYVDLPDRTLAIKVDPNYAIYYCERCGARVEKPVQEKPDTTVIWRKELKGY